MDVNQDFTQLLLDEEKRDLEDFEILEKLSKDDVSFLSSLSTVDKLLEDHHSCTDTWKDASVKNGNFNKEKKDFSSKSVLNNFDTSKLTKNNDLKDSFAFYEEQDVEAWSGEVSQEEDGDCVNEINEEVSNNESNNHGSSGGNHDVKDDQSTKNPTSRFQNPSILSQLAERLFPAMKDSTLNISSIGNSKFGNSKLKESAACSFELSKKVPIGAGVPSELLQGKLREIEGEIRKFKKENESICEQKKTQNDYTKLLKKELAEFEMRKKIEKEDFEKYKNSELQKLKREKKVFEKYKSDQENSLSREGRKEVDCLKGQLDELKTEFKEKERKHQMGVDRWKERVIVLERENERLKDELALRERDRCELVRQLDGMRITGVDRTASKHYKEHMLKKEEKCVVSEDGIKIDEVPTHIPLDTSDLDIKYLMPSTDTNEVLDRTIMQDGATRIQYSNGTTKTTFPDSHTTITYFNGDTKDSYTDGRTVYFFSNSKTRHHTFPDRTEVYYFENGQSEKHYPVGTREVTFADGTIKFIDPHRGTTETIFPDGSLLKQHSDGSREMEFANGQREVHTPESRRREYPDGTCKVVMLDGSQQTTYPSGRTRLKDTRGNVVFDGFK